MAKNYDEMDTEELKALAEERQQRQAALNQLARSDPSAMKAMTANERQDFLKDQEKQRRDEWHQELHDARERRLDGMRQIAARDHGRYSPEVFAPTLSNGARAALAYLERQENRPERIREFDETQKTERFKAEQEAAGKIGYGRDAASIQSAANKEIAQTEWGTKERIAQGEIAAKKWLGETESKDRRYGIDAEHGKIGEDGKVTPGSRERTTQIQGESEVKKQEAANKGLLAQAEITRQNKEKELATQIEKAQIAAGGKADSAKIASHAKIISAALQGGALQNKDAGTVLAELAEQYKNDPEMLSFIKSAGGGQQQQPQIPGYSPEKVAELQKRGYKWDGKQWVKPE